MKPEQTLLLSRADIAGLLEFREYIELVERAFRLHAIGNSLSPCRAHVDSANGGFHLKIGGLKLDRTFFAVKVNGNFPRNPELFGMPKVHGLIVLCDGETGYPLAVMDSKEITVNRTGAAVAVGAKYLAVPGSTVATIIGCGIQGRVQLRALMEVLSIRKAFAISRDIRNAEAFASEMAARLKVEVVATSDIPAALRQSHVCVTCTRSNEILVRHQDVPEGMFIAAVGADSPHKQELDPKLLISFSVVVDLVDQCAEAGELHHALKAGMRVDQVRGTLAEVVVGSKVCRQTDRDIVILDLTGTALQDSIAAVGVYEKAVARGIGSKFQFFA